MKSLLPDAHRLAWRFLQPPGVTVVLCGADGSGKSTAARAVIEGLSGTFSPSKVHHFHWKPPLFSARRQAARGPATDPHGQACRAIRSFRSATSGFTGWSSFSARTCDCDR